MYTVWYVHDSMKQALVAWIGKSDLEAARAGDVHKGSISEAAASGQFFQVWALDNWLTAESCEFTDWVGVATGVPVVRVEARIKSPSDLASIYEEAVRVVERMRRDGIGTDALAFHMGPGTSTMSAAWLLVAAKYDVRLIRSTEEDGVIDVPMPFDIVAEYRASRNVERLSAGEELQPTHFGRILYRCAAMARAVEAAKRAALTDWNVIIQGPSGAGKELFAEAIHRASVRSGKPFIKVNCGAIPSELIEAELFGYVKGAFTGATTNREGKFEAADGGTIFLDEIGDMPVSAQVRLLRVLEDRKVIPVGSNVPKATDVRVIAATHRDLVQLVDEGRFREDLMYRLLVLPITVPALKDRQGDLGMLIDAFLDEINAGVMAQLRANPLRLSPGARKLLLNHGWPGNVRELKNTLLRCAAASLGQESISQELAAAQILRLRRQESVLGRTMCEGFDIRSVLAEVARHYLSRAMEQAEGNKTAAARLVGLKNYQTLDKWLARYS
jgi:transcriptional regulator with PAS, ATPase and Fis domain